MGSRWPYKQESYKSFLSPIWEGEVLFSPRRDSTRLLPS